MGIWSPNYEAREVFGSRRESHNSREPMVSVNLHVAQDDLYGIVRDLVYNRHPFPLNTYFPYEVFSREVEVLPIDSKYVPDTRVASPEEAMATTLTREIRVSYKPNRAFAKLIVTTTETGTATQYGYESQTPWVTITREMQTEFLTQDFNDFDWYNPLTQTYDPVKPEESPGRQFRTIKYTYEYENIFLTDDIEWAIYYYNGSVNNSSLVAAYDLMRYDEDQVLFQVEDIKPALRTPSTPDSKILHNLRCSFYCRTGFSTWNKYWRAVPDEDDGEDASGWYEMYHKPLGDQESRIRYKPYRSTAAWYFLWD